MHSSLSAAILIPVCLGLCSCALFRDAPEEVLALRPVQRIPPQYRGLWSDSLENCDVENGDRSRWSFVTEQSVGSFEHIYEATQIRVGVNRVEVTTRGAGRVEMRELAPGTVQFVQQDGSTASAVRCPQGTGQ